MKKEIKYFGAKVDKVLNLMINSLYTNKSIFIRELISNASDACDKMRYQNIIGGNKIEEKLNIKIEVDKNNQEIIFLDNGIGMNKDDLISNIGTIASSGTQNFITKCKNKNSNLIGEFGVGFYSAFMVSEKITILSKKFDEDKIYKWESEGNNTYTIEEIKDHEMKRGTMIRLKIKSKSSEFLDYHRIKHVVKTYSDHINFSIFIVNDKKEKELINSKSALWIRNKEDISLKQYEDFFYHISYFSDKPWSILHNKIEGNISYTNLLFIPGTKPFESLHTNRKTQVKLYVKRVLISEKNNNIIPSYLRFVVGIVDSEDLPLNISRETLQNNNIVIRIKKNITKRIIASLNKICNEEKYYVFWNNFGEILKEGLCENNDEEQINILKICKFYSTLNKEKLITLDNYISNMRKNQNEIYYLNGDNLNMLYNNPQIEGFRKRNIPVILLKDHVDNFWVNIIKEYKGIKLKSITNEKIDLDKINKINRDLERKDINNDKNYNMNAKLIYLIKEVLGKRVKDVVISSKLVNSPACISNSEGRMSLRMERVLMNHNQSNTQIAKIFEINPEHPVFKKIKLYINDKNNSNLNKKLINSIFNLSLLIEGESLENPSEFAHTVNEIFSQQIK